MEVPAEVRDRLSTVMETTEWKFMWWERPWLWCHMTRAVHERPLPFVIKTESCQDAHFVALVGTAGCPKDNLQCHQWQHSIMMTSSNGNIFRVTGPLCGEFTGPGEFPTQRPVTRSFDVFFDLRLNNRLSKHSWGWWFETLSCSLWRHRNDYDNSQYIFSVHVANIC